MGEGNSARYHAAVPAFAGAGLGGGVEGGGLLEAAEPLLLDEVEVDAVALSESFFAAAL